MGTVGDQQWIAEQFRFSSNWSAIEICHRCLAESRAGALDFAQSIDLSERSHSSYMTSRGAAISVLARAPGFHTSTIRGEAMHAGPLGALPDAIGSCVVEMCDEGVFGGETLSPWELRLQVQVNVVLLDVIPCCWAPLSKTDFEIYFLGGCFTFANRQQWSRSS